MKNSAAPPRPPGDVPIHHPTCTDISLGRGSGTQNHCGNVTFRKLVVLNKELYASSTKFDKLKISKAIVAAIRAYGGRFLAQKKNCGGLYFDIGDKRAWEKTSQALREGQAEVRARLAEGLAELEKSASFTSTVAASNADAHSESRVKKAPLVSRVGQYKHIISNESFRGYSMQVLECLLRSNPATASVLAAYPSFTGEAPTAASISPPESKAPTSAKTPPLAGNAPVLDTPSAISGNALASAVDANATEGRYVAATNHMSGRSSPQCQQQLHPSPASTVPPPASSCINVRSCATPVVCNNMPSLESKCSYTSSRASTDRMSSLSIISLRGLLGSSDMDLLSEEVDGMIHRSSAALSHIDQCLASEDLVFEEDSMKDQNPTGAKDLDHDDSVSLMNMSIMSINEDFPSRCSMSLMNLSSLSINEDFPSRSDRLGPYPIQKTLVHDEGVPAIVGHKHQHNHVHFDKNVSAMSIDATENIKKLASATVDPQTGEDSSNEPSANTNETVDGQTSLGALGLPVRKHASKRLLEGLPTIIARKPAGQKRISELTVDDDVEMYSSFLSSFSMGESERAFKHMAAEVSNSVPRSSLKSNFSDI